MTLMTINHKWRITETTLLSTRIILFHVHLVMWESTINTNILEKHYNAETYRLIGEEKLHEYGDFLEEYTHLTNLSQSKFSSLYTKEKTIFVDEEPFEKISTPHLACCDNATLSRILCTLGAICQELDFLKNESEKLYSSILFYGEDCTSSPGNKDCISEIIEPLQKILVLIRRAEIVINLTLRQLGGILHKEYYISNSSSRFSEVLSSFADLLVCLLKFDTLLDKQVLKNDWICYKRRLKNFIHTNSKIRWEFNELQAFSNMLLVLENSLLSGSIFKDTIDSCLNNKLVIDFKIDSLNAEFYNYLTDKLNELDKDDDVFLHMKDIVDINVLAAFYFNIFGVTDKRFTKRLLEKNKKISGCSLIGNKLWYPEHFLVKHVQSLLNSIDRSSIESNRLYYINSKVQNLQKETNTLSYKAFNFILELENKMKANPITIKVKQLKEMAEFLLAELKIVEKVKRLIKWILNVHFDKNLPVTKTVLNCVGRLVESLKHMHSAFQRHMPMINFFITLISQHLQHTAISMLDTLKKNQTQLKSYKDKQLDILSAIKVCESALKGPNTKLRILIANLALSASGLVPVAEIRSILNQLEIAAKFTQLLKIACDCSIFYWHFHHLMPAYFRRLIAFKSNLSKCYPLLYALSDCLAVEENDISSEIHQIWKEELCMPINHIAETNLRVQTHLHLQLPPSDPFRDYFPLCLNKIMPVPLKYAYKNIKIETEHYLSYTFYNLTTVVLYDWKTYGEMRRLATLQYGVETIDDELPMQTLDQGLDVLEIMRNINVFVQKYLYNLNTQIFIEESSSNKYLNSIGISHVANSIRTHGIGIMNTTVNYTYQFLKNKFKIFSQFLFDEQIKSRLLKDLRHFSDHKDQYNQLYPYERADKFNRGIRKLGTPDGKGSYLDLFRKVITHIGNAMGYIRLIRSGGNRCLAEGTCFIPDLIQTDFIQELFDAEDLTELPQNEANVLLKNIRILTDNFENTTEYFKLLVKAFSSHFRSRSNMHLRNFYIIVPSLTINFIEHSLTCKERLYKKDKANCAFTDDGFALGLAYVIELLDQEAYLNSLHWFESVQKKLATEIQNIREQTMLSNLEDVKLKQTLTLTERRINTFQREFKLLEYSFCSAKFFFQS
ncbi:WASH complex subunit 4 isoform X2 [Anthonomus grandis grandis]|uniref:WASH complex subunit 4 isoform X2 n=1 Tax=Anthonomus grandis grandis TaxID=2921223 RepID=UPI0021660F94|nr:WASH complex subunit 4 isoform X2 [Anthonomus grandis grandis]